MIHVDSFGNLITSLPAELLAAGRRRGGRRSRSKGRRGASRPVFGRTFSDVPSGALIGYIGSGGQLEIARRDGSAAARMGAGRGTAVRVTARHRVGRDPANWPASPSCGTVEAVQARSFPDSAGSVAVAGGVSAAGCTIGDGTGTATGPLWILGCLEGKPYGTPADPELFHLEPDVLRGRADRGHLRRGHRRTASSSGCSAPATRSRSATRCTSTSRTRTRSRTACAAGRSAACPTGTPRRPARVDPTGTTPWCEPMRAERRPAHSPGSIRSGARGRCSPLCDLSLRHAPAGGRQRHRRGEGRLDRFRRSSAARSSRTSAPEMRGRRSGATFKVNYGERPDRAASTSCWTTIASLTALYKRIDVPPAPRIGGMLRRRLRLRPGTRPRRRRRSRSRPVVPNDQVSVEIESLAPGGDAVGRQQGGEGARAADDGRVTFVAARRAGRARARAHRAREGEGGVGRADGDRAPGRRVACRRPVRCSAPAAAASGST